MMKTRHYAPLGLALLAGVAFAATQPPATPAQGSAQASATRDWTQIDTDKDGYISAAEMQAHLDAEAKARGGAAR